MVSANNVVLETRREIALDTINSLLIKYAKSDFKEVGSDLFREPKLVKRLKQTAFSQKQ